MYLHEFVELALAGMAKRRMTDIVHQGQGFREFAVQAQCGSDGARDLRDFERVREAIAKMVGIAGGEDLRFRFQTAKSPRVDNAIAVARILGAVAMARFMEAAAARKFFAHGKIRK